ncbi:MAG: ATP synthase F1 subunit delta [Bacteroidales bacterium]|nr:ATP synthase F1 subunit delta [Bacteroidales bacterium]
MNDSKITVRYAKALFSLAKEKQLLDDIKKDMTLVYSVCNDIDEFSLLLESPVIKPSKKLSIINTIFKNKINDISLSFLKLVIKNRRDNYLKLISLNFIDFYKKSKGIKTVVLTSAVELDKDLKTKIIDQIKKSLKTEIELSEKVDKDILGGFILRIEDKQIDASISTKLKNIKQKLINTSIDK